MKKISVLLIIVLIYGCNSNKNDYIEISLEKNESYEFSNIDSIRLNIKYNDSMHIYTVHKLIEFNDTTYLFLDIYSSYLYFMNKKGQLIKKIGGKGHGPGEFSLIYDFTIDKQKNIYILDPNENIVGKFDKSGNYLRKYLLSFTHRRPSKIDYYNNFFIVSAENNLKEGASRTNFEFLEYEDISYLNIYDYQFDKKKSFLKTDPELYSTLGAFSRPWGCFTPFTITENNLIALTQEGFYKINVFDFNFNLVRKYSISNKYFKELNPSDYSDFKIYNNYKTNYSIEKKGEITGNHSIPVSAYYSNPYLAIEIREPLENYFAMFVENYDPKFHIDIFKLKNGELLPVTSNLKINGRIIGSSNRGGIFYFAQSDVINDQYTYIIKKKINEKTQNKP